MDSINIIQPAAFIFFILVITIGYILVEIIWWEGYWFRKSLKRYPGSNIVDRLIHYISIGILFHFIMIIVISYVGKTEIIDQAMLIWYNFSQSIHFTDGNSHFETLLNIQFIVSALLYFTFIIIFFVVTWAWVWIGKWISLFISKMPFNKKKTIIAWGNKNRIKSEIK